MVSEKNKDIERETKAEIMKKYLAEVDASDAIADTVKRRRPAHYSHNIGNYEQHGTRHPRFSRQTHLRKRHA